LGEYRERERQEDTMSALKESIPARLRWNLIRKITNKGGVFGNSRFKSRIEETIGRQNRIQQEEKTKKEINEPVPIFSMKKLLLSLILIILFTFGIVSITEAETETKTEANTLKGKLGIGLGYPWVSIKYGITHKFSIEVRGAFGSGINVYGVRLYYNFNPKHRIDRIVIFTGLEGDYVSFNVDTGNKEEKMSGNGYIGYTFLGGEYFITKRFTLNLDIGPAFISLEEDEFNLSVDGIEYVFNLGINFYFK
jgi:hypothetical protein